MALTIDQIRKMQEGRRRRSSRISEAQLKPAQSAGIFPKDDPRAARLAQVPETMQSAYISAATGKAPPRTAIKAMCNECQGYDRIGIRNCTAPACPLYHYRPGANR